MLTYAQHYDNIDWSQPVNWTNPLNHGLVSWYLCGPPQTGTGTRRVRDLCGRNHGTVTNITFSSTAGWNPPTRTRSMGEFRFAGVGMILVPDAPNLGGMAGLTLAAWVKPTGTFSCIAKWLSGNSWVWYTSAGAAMRLFVNSGSVDSTGTVASGVWSWLSCSYDGANVHFYINGLNVGSPAKVSGAITDSAAAMTIGDDGGSSFANGAIDGPRIYNRSLPANQHWNLFREASLNYPNLLTRLGTKRGPEAQAAAAGRTGDLLLLGCGA